jgi:hypothetical protein
VTVQIKHVFIAALTWRAFFAQTISEDNANQKVNKKPTDLA